ncbi:SDR family NAD(P)-dependent oxidoreductase [Endozoicomonas elysicola]|uniref:Oxidoreductase n=1 Tax=Endozoicomonas elysicola TaxID=305900 RepID=A0A081KDC0_9GAMM|nr:SDR family NAD(P)-dependent oxidoreductase [Endozoicomonas elysicola]KEI72146.1 oxidoreductase [Endozoicomonas elysicola]
MKKTILVTGSTDGIGLATARTLIEMGHHVLIHGRSASKLKEAELQLAKLTTDGAIESYLADLSNMDDVTAMTKAIAERHHRLDAVINNAGIFKVSEPVTRDGLDVRFAVNAIAPYLLTRQLMPLLDASSRVINLSSAAQAPVNLKALTGDVRLEDDLTAYAQSKLALTVWSHVMAESMGESGPVIIAINPGSLLGSKMVKEGFGVAGGDISIGADILCRAALSEEFATASGRYFDNDIGQFSTPHTDALNQQKNKAVVDTIEAILSTQV